MSSRDVVRAVVRGVLVSIGLALLATPQPTLDLRLPPVSAAYAGLLVIPAALLESRLGDDVGFVLRSLAATVIALVALVAACVAHAQAVYAAGVFETGALEGGLTAVQFEWARLQRPLEHVGPLWLLHAGAAGALAVALGCTSVTLPLVASRPEGWVGRAVGTAGASLACALLVVSLTICEALTAAQGWTHGWYVVQGYVCVASGAPLLVMAGAWWVSTWLVRDPGSARCDVAAADP